MKLLHSTTALCLALYAANASAVLDAVIVSGARTEQSQLSTPAAITVITRQQIENSGAEHIVDVLRGVGSIFVQDSFGDGSRATVSMRGFSGSAANSNTLIMIDGRRLNNTDLSSPDLNSIAIKDIQRIEIVQGSAGVLFGDQAVGGVINIITSTANKQAGSVTVQAGSYRNVGVSAVVGDEITQRLSYRITAEARKSDNYRRDNNVVEYSNLLLRTQYDTDGGKLFAELQRIDEDLGLPGSLLDAEIAVDRRQTFVDFLGDFTNSDTEVVRVGAQQKLSSDWSFEGEASYRNVERDIQQSFRGFVVTTPSQLQRRQVEITPRLIGRFAGDKGEWQLTAGVDLIDTDFNSTLTFSSDEQRLLSLYVQSVMPVADKMDVTVGYRRATVEDDVVSGFTNGKQDTDADVFELGVVRQLDKNSRVFARIDQNFRFAKVDELTYVSPGSQLKPQTGNSIELGWSQQADDANYQLSVYQLQLEDEIAFDPTATQPTGAVFPGANVNFDPTTHRGLIAEASRQLTQQINLSASYSFTDASFDSGVFAGNAISGVPENTARIGLNHKLSSRYFYQLDAVYIGSHYLDGDNANAQAKVSAYTVVNLNLGLDYSDFSINLKVNNLGNRKYVENANSFGSRFPMPERNLLLKARWDW
jgi:iron complex outermembrane receptor protein